MALLETTDMTVSFGGLRAVDSVDFAVEKGQLVGLIGPNGAGKTTFIDGITGFVGTSGSIRFNGREVSREPAHRRARLGLGRTWQSLELFEDLTIEENLQVAAEQQSVGGFIADLILPQRRRAQANVEFALDVLGIGELAQRMPTEISQGQRKLVSAAPRARRPPAARVHGRARGRPRHHGVAGSGRPAAPDHRLRYHDLPRRPRHGSRAQRVRLHLRDRVRAEDRGRDPGTDQADPRVIEAYLGSSADPKGPSESETQGS